MTTLLEKIRFNVESRGIDKYDIPIMLFVIAEELNHLNKTLSGRFSTQEKTQ